MKKKFTPAFAVLAMLVLTVAIGLAGCGTDNNPAEEKPTVTKITAEEGKAMMDEDMAIILVDVRTEAEFAEEHIPGAILVPIDDLEALAPDMMPDKAATYIIYCRSGNRSATASQQLIELGYQNIYDMGGIIDWPYETESGN
jgi:rhodanese-related sulfurtransferase